MSVATSAPPARGGSPLLSWRNTTKWPRAAGAAVVAVRGGVAHPPAAARRWLAVAVVLLWAAAVGLAGPYLPFRGVDLRLTVLAACAAAAALARPPGGRSGGVLSLWGLPAAVLLPPSWALITSAPLAALDCWRVSRARAWRLAVTAAAAGLSYGGASLAFHEAATLAGHWLAHGSPGWLAAVAVCGALQRVVSRVLSPASGPGSPAGPTPLRVRADAAGWLAELSASVVVTAAVAASPWFAIPAVPAVIALERSRQHARLAAAARTDAKTGLLNAGAWQQAVGAQAARAIRSGRPLAVAMVDIDHFKKVNDTWGHLVGDQVLAAIARVLARQLRPYDVAGRFGGEEFAVLLPDATEAGACLVAERLRSGIAATRPLPGSTLRVTVSIGVAVAIPSRADHLDLVAAADEALYRAKQSGRNQVRLAS